MSTPCHFHALLLCQFDREHFSEVFVDLKWFESKVGNKYLNEAAGLAAEEADAKVLKSKVRNILLIMKPVGSHMRCHFYCYRPSKLFDKVLICGCSQSSDDSLCLAALDGVKGTHTSGKGMHIVVHILSLSVIVQCLLLEQSGVRQ